MLADIRVEWETYNVDLNDRPHEKESVRPGDAPSHEPADGSEAVSVSENSIQEGPESDDNPHASTPDVAVIMGETLEAF